MFSSGSFLLRRGLPNGRISMPLLQRINKNLMISKSAIISLTRSNLIQRSYSNLPDHPNRRESRKEFVANSTSFSNTIELNLKWLLIRQNRPFNTDDLSAFVSWFVWSNILWFVLGTTTFMSLVVWTAKSFDSINDGDQTKSSLFNKIMLKMLFKYDPSKINVTFIQKNDIENVSPDFRKGVITFRNIKLENSKKHDTNLKFEVVVEKMDVTLNFNKWNQGKGLVDDIEVVGMKGSIINNLTDNDILPNDKNYLSESILPNLFNDNGKFQFNNIKLFDVKLHYDSLNLKDKGIDLDIFNLEFPKLRMEWFLIDILKPKVCSGSINSSLFTVHQKQLNKSTQFINKDNLANFSADPDESNINLITRIQIHEIDMKNNPLLIDKFNWVTDGKVNLICDITLPNENQFNLNDFIQDIKSKVNNDILTKIDLDELTRKITPVMLDLENSFSYNNLFHDTYSGGAIIQPVKEILKLRDNDQPAEEMTDLKEEQQEEQEISKKRTNRFRFGDSEDYGLVSEKKFTLHDYIKSIPNPSNPNKYLFFDLKLQFINPIAKTPSSLPSSNFTNKSYISMEDLNPIIALVNNSPNEKSFFSNRQTTSILSPSEITSLQHTLQPSNIVGPTSLDSDKQFTVSSSIIYSLDDLYGKVSWVRETRLVDNLIESIYEELENNLHYELHTRMVGNNNNGSFTIGHLLGALRRRADSDNDDWRLFMMRNRPTYGISLLVLLGLGAIF